MTDSELKKLKDDLWHSADMLCAGAHLAANKYGQPILGLIFLRYADILFKQHKEEIDREFSKLKNSRMAKSPRQIAIEKCGFYLPEEAYYDWHGTRFARCVRFPIGREPQGPVARYSGRHRGGVEFTKGYL